MAERYSSLAPFSVVLVGTCLLGILAAAYLGLSVWLMHTDGSVAILTITTDDSYPNIPKPLASAYLRYGHYNPNVTTAGDMPLFNFVCAGYGLLNTHKDKILELAALLARRGASVDSRHWGFTALQAAVLANEPELVRHLLLLGADSRLAVNHPGKPYDGMNSLELARYFDSKRSGGMREVISILQTARHN